MCGLTSNVYADADSISINFGAEKGAPTGGDLGVVPVNWQYWNNAENATGTIVNLINNTGAATGASGTWNSDNTYRYSTTSPSTDNNAILYYGYLDDTNAHQSFTMDAAPYFSYDLYYYASTDRTAFRYAKINGVDYTGGSWGTQTGTGNWGTPVKANIDASDFVEAVNYLRVSSTSPSISISGVARDNSNTYRGSFAALQIVNTANSLSTIASNNSLDWSTASWTNDLTGASVTTPSSSVVGYRIIYTGTATDTFTVDLKNAAVNLPNVKLLGNANNLVFSNGTINQLGKTDAVLDFAAAASSVTLPNIGQVAPQGVVKFNSNVTTTDTTADKNVISGAYFIGEDSSVKYVQLSDGAFSAVTPESVTNLSDITSTMNLYVKSALTDNQNRTINSLTTEKDYINSNTLTVTSGMITLQGGNHYIKSKETEYTGKITSGYKNSAGEYDLYVCTLGTSNNLRIYNSSIIDPNEGKLNLIKTGSGALSIVTDNPGTFSSSYTGKTSVLEGKLYICETIASKDFYIAPDAQLYLSSKSYNNTDIGDFNFTAKSLSGYGSLEIGNSNGKISLTLQDVTNDGSQFEWVSAYGKELVLNDSQLHTKTLWNRSSVELNGSSEIVAEYYRANTNASTLTIKGEDSTFTVEKDVQLGFNGGTAAGTKVKIVQENGTANVGNLGIGHWGNYDASYEISGGTLNVGDHSFINGTLSDGSPAVFKDIWLTVSSNGALLQEGGVINTTGIDLHTRGTGAVGTYTMTKGVLNMGVNGFYRNENAGYAINLAGGTITAGAEALPENQRGDWSTVLDAVLTGTTGTDDARVTFAPAADFTITWSGVLSGDGGLIVNGDGTLSLSGANTYAGLTTVSKGVLQLTDSAMNTPAPITVEENGTLEYFVAKGETSDPVLVTSDNAINSVGTVMKGGNGTLKIFAESDAFKSESFVVNSGRLDMKEFFKGSLTVENGATLSPGNSIGTLTIDGIEVHPDMDVFTLEAGSTLLMEIGYGENDQLTSDMLIVNGSVNIDPNSTVFLTLLDGTVLPPNTTFTVDLISGSAATEDMRIAVSDVLDSYYFKDYKLELNGGVIQLTATVDPNAVPEPSTWALLALGVVVLFLRKRVRS